MGTPPLIIAASYNKECDGPQGIITEYKTEVGRGRVYPNHYIKRWNTEEVKFLWHLCGVPMVAYAYVSALRSEEATDIAIVGNKAVGSLVELLNEEFKPQDKRFVFAHEGDSWSLRSTVTKGVEAAMIEKDGGYGMVCGDIPLFYDYDALLSDTDADTYDAVLDLNGFENIFKGQEWPGHFPRYYHWNVNTPDGDRAVKEPNCYMLRRVQPVMDIMEETYATRKTGRSSGIAGMLARECLWKRRAETWSYLWAHERRNLFQLAKDTVPFLFRKAFDPDVRFSGRNLNPTEDTVSYLLSIGTGATMRVKARHHDPGRIEDVDSIEDWMILHAMLSRDNAVYPHMEDIHRVRSEVMPKLSGTMFDGFPTYANELAMKLGLGVPLYDDGTFSEKFLQQRTKITQKMIENGVACHKRFNENRAIRTA